MSEIIGAEEKEIRITLNTGEGQVSFKTDKIIGKLNSVIIDTPSKSSVLIESELGYILLRKAEIEGVNYFSIRNRSTAPEENLMDVPDFEEFMLNESLIITVMGQKNIEISFIIRIG